ncbi:MAG: RIP metalloprotease RseP [Bacteriovoracaceae bacterium]|nr:RIP metalloprotease RseP [Bacteriovoracaceae bacterium]
MIEKIGIFILFLFPLVFFHELGHFFFAKLFRVRVDTFSIGFGPKLLKVKWGETQYCISLIPFGGYVKMFGESMLDKDEIPQEEKDRSLVYKNKWQRFWIVFGGPLFNFIFAFIIYFFLAVGGEKLPEVKFGLVGENSILYSKGVRTADVLSQINESIIESPTDISVDDTSYIKSISVFRNKDEVSIPIEMSGKVFFAEFQKAPALFRMPIVIDAAGMKYAVSTSPSTVNWMTSMEELALSSNKEFYLFQAIDAVNSVADLTTKKTIRGKNLNDALVKSSHYPLDLLVEDLTADSAAKAVGIEVGDLLYAIGGKKIVSFEDLRMQVNSERPHLMVTVIRNGAQKTYKVIPKEMEYEGVVRKMIGVQSAAIFLPPSYRTLAPKGLIDSASSAFFKTGDAISKTFSGIIQLLSAKVSFKNVGGPLMIGKYASDTFRMSFSFFMQFMAIVSVNLALINLFPIPVLDGGHILFIILEFVNRGPLSNRKVEIAQQIGLSLLLLLMISAIFNDVTRFFF